MSAELSTGPRCPVCQGSGNQGGHGQGAPCIACMGSRRLVPEPRETFLSICDDLTAYYETRDLLEAQRPDETALWDKAQVDDVEEWSQSIAAVGRHIEEIGAALAGKTDSAAGVIRRMEAETKIDRDESRRLAARADRGERAIKWLKGYLLESMRSRGLKHIKTALNTLAITKNGGVAPLVISNPTILPDDLCKMEGWIRGDAWTLIQSIISAEWEIRAGGDTSAGGEFEPSKYFPTVVHLQRIPNNEAIREALDKTCSTCGGIVNPWTACGECGGTGKATVPGAQLGPRGEHLGVR